MGNVHLLNAKSATPELTLKAVLEDVQKFEGVIVIAIKPDKLIDLYASFIPPGDWAVATLVLQKFVMFEGELQNPEEE